MKKLNDLKAKRTEIALRYNEIMASDKMTDELRTEATNISEEIRNIDSDIQLVERQIELASQEANDVPEQREDPNFYTELRNYFQTGVVPQEFRGEKGGFKIPGEMLRGDLKTTTNSGIINKTVEDNLSIAKSPALGIMEKLGVRKYSGLNGQFVVPSMAQVNAGFAAETVAVSDASGTPTSLTLSPRRLGAYNVVSKETLASTNPSIWNGIVQDIVDAYYRAQLGDLFDQIQTDAVDASTTISGSTLAYSDLVDLQADVPYDVASPAYVTTPSVASFLKKTATISSVAGPVWDGPLMDGMIDGLPAIASGLANDDTLIYADFSQAVVAEFGDGLEILVNPYEYDAEGKIKVTVSGLTDTGFGNYRFSSWIADVSI